MEPNQIPNTSSKPKFNLWLITTIVLAIFLIASGVVFAWQKSVSNKIKNNLQSQINSLQNQVQRLTETNTKLNLAEIAGWKATSGTGFEIKYPPNWYVERSHSGATDPVDVEITNFNPVGLFDGIVRPVQLDVIVSPISEVNNIPLQEAVKEHWAYNNSSLIPEQLSGIDGYKIAYPEGKSWHYFYFNGNFYKILISPSIQDKDKNLNAEDSDVLNRILSTLKFTK